MALLLTAISTLISIPLVIYNWIHQTFFTLDMSKKAPVFITGCDTGFGHLLAVKLIQNGINTFAGCLTEAGEVELRKAADRGPGKLWTVHLDVTDQFSVDHAVNYVKGTLGPGKGLWGLVNNAGVVGSFAPDDWLTVDDYQKVLDVNFLGVVRVTQAFKPLVKLERGRIVTVTSVFGRVASPACGPYCASKYAAEAYCDVVRRELAAFGVSVHILEPGFFATKLTNPNTLVSIIKSLWENAPPEVKEQYGDEYYEQNRPLTPTLPICDGALMINDALSANLFVSAAEALSSNLPPLCSTNLNLVVNAYYDALTSIFPLQRYYCGADAKYFYVPLSTFPGYVQDWIFKLLLKLNNAPAPRAAKESRRV